MPGHPRRPTAPRFRMPWATVQSRTENACRHSLGRAISREATQRGCGDDMSRLWSAVVEGLTPYVPGEQPHVADLVKLNTNESPFGPSPRALEAIRAAATDDLRLYPDFDATELRETLADYHGVKPEQVFPGNGSDEVLGHTFAALLKHEAPLLFPDVTYSFYPVYCRLFGIAFETVPVDEEMRVRVADYRRPAGAIILANPN